MGVEKLPDGTTIHVCGANAPLNAAARREMVDFAMYLRRPPYEYPMTFKEWRAARVKLEGGQDGEA
jgi:hypothetical protein